MPISESGGVVFKLEKGTPYYLLVRPKKHLNEWLFPKGHIESGESPEMAATREVREEAGVDAEVVGRLGPATFTYEGQELHVEFFLLNYLRDSSSLERREVRWSTYEEALQLLSFPEARDILRAAYRLQNPGVSQEQRPK